MDKIKIMIGKQEEAFHAELNIQDYVDFRISNDEDARKRGKFRKISHWLHHTHIDNLKQFQSLKDDLEHVKMESKQIKVQRNSIQKQQVVADEHFAHLARHDHTLKQLDEEYKLECEKDMVLNKKIND